MLEFRELKECMQKKKKKNFAEAYLRKEAERASR